MMQLAIFGFLLGAVVALRFRVWILVPLTLAALAALGAWHLIYDTKALLLLEQSCLMWLALQFGYAFGLLARGISVGARSRRRCANDSFPRGHPVNHV